MDRGNKRGQLRLAAALALMTSGQAALADDAGCLRDLRASAIAAGVNGGDFDRVTQGLTIDPGVLRFYSNQPEVKRSPADYVRMLVDDKRVADARKALSDHKSTFADVERRYGVPSTVLAAIWGIETDFGRAMGKRPTLQALASLVCGGARVTYFRGEFILAVKILASGKASERQRMTATAPRRVRPVRTMPRSTP